MSTITIPKKELKTIKIGRAPFIIFPLDEWFAMEEKLEDLEMRASSKLATTIAKRRKEKKVIGLGEMLRKYGI